MTRSFFLRLVLLNTFKKRLRALLVIGGIAVTSSAMIMLFGISLGLHGLVNDQVQQSESRDVVTVDQRNIQQIRFDQEHLSEIQSVNGVGQLETSVALVGNLIHNGIDLNVPVYGVSKGFFALSPATFSAGSADKLSGTNVVVSTKVLDALGIDAAKAIGTAITTSVVTSRDQASGQADDQVTSKPQDFTIVGVVDKGALPVAYLPLETMRGFGVDTMSQLKLRAATPDAVPTVRESVEQMGFQTTSIQDTVEQINKIFSVIQRAVVVFAIIMFAITVAGTFTTISLTLMEEMKQIGFLRINGLRNRDVHVMFLLQSVILTFLGAVAGVLGGVFGGAVLNGIARATSAGQAFSDRVTIFAIPGLQIGLVLVLSIVIGYLVGVLPAKRAVMMKPLEELRA